MQVLKEKAIFKFIETTVEAENPISKTHLEWEKTAKLVNIVQVSMFSGSIMHCKTLVLKVIPRTTFYFY